MGTRIGIGIVFACLLGTALPAPAHASGAEALRARHGEVKDALAKSPFGRPIVMDSQENGDRLKGEVYGVVNHAFETLSRSLRQPGNWCDVFVLPLHVKECRAEGGKLTLLVGSRPQVDESQAVRLQFSVGVTPESADYLGLQLTATEGPFGTKDYKVAFEAVPMDGGKSFVHITYAYAYGSAAKMATQAYLSTSGKGKVGFTQGVDGVRGILERNAMRYFIAIDTYLASLSAPAPQRIDKRLRDWIAALERHPRQLRETEPNYAELKRGQMQGLRRTAAAG